MNLAQRIQEDFKRALKERNEKEIRILRLLMAVLLNKEKEKRVILARKQKDLSEKELIEASKLNDEEVIETLSFELRKRKEAIAEFEKGKREDLIKKEKEEIEILQRYLPKQLTSEEIEDLCSQVIKDIGAKDLKDFGKVMQIVMPKLKGRADGKEVSAIVKKLLSLS
ncbi:GatB/YqeY domain-containing protein [bacterium]|nr:GatB/YqeY domain-containing protein [bacterium]